MVLQNTHIFCRDLFFMPWQSYRNIFFLNMRCSSIVALSEQDMRGLWSEMGLGQERCVWSLPPRKWLELSRQLILEALLILFPPERYKISSCHPNWGAVQEVWSPLVALLECGTLKLPRIRSKSTTLILLNQRILSTFSHLFCCSVSPVPHV